VVGSEYGFLRPRFTGNFDTESDKTLLEAVCSQSESVMTKTGIGKIPVIIGIVLENFDNGRRKRRTLVERGSFQGLTQICQFQLLQEDNGEVRWIE